MKFYSKKSLELKENTYSKKDVSLKEASTIDTTTNFNDFNNVARGLNNGQKMQMNATPQQPEMNATVIRNGNNPLSGDDVKNQIGQDTIDVAKKTNANLNITAVTPKQSTSTNQTQMTMESVLFTKKEMSNFLKTL